MKRAALLILLTGCSLNPFDPMIGPRNPRPGATRYFATRNDIAPSDKQHLLEYEDCPLTALRTLSSSPSREVRALVAANPAADAAILERLSADADPAVRQYVGGNQNIPRHVLKKLAGDSDPNVRFGLASNPRWTASEIRSMYHHKTAVFSEIAANPSAPPDVLKELSYGSDYNVLTALAGNPSIPPYVINRLANDPKPSVRLMLVDNKALPVTVLGKLAKDPDEEVRKAALDELARRRTGFMNEQP